MSNATQPLPNPDIYLNHFPPDEATHLEVVRIVHAAFLGGVIWDVLAFIPEDVKMLKQGSGGNVATICYLITRIAAASCVSLWVTLEARPISNCQAILDGINAACIVTMATSSYLFLKRAQAVYSGNRLANWVFSLAFAGANLSNLLLLFAIKMTHIPGTGYCTTSKVELYGSATYFFAVFFDTLVFVSISYKLAYQSPNNINTGGSWATRLFTGKMLPIVSRAIVQGGQKYYLVGLICRLIALTLTLAPSIPLIYRTALMSPSIIVTSVMVCRVHRNMALTFYNLNGDVTDMRTRVMTSIHFAPSQQAPGEIASHVVIEDLSGMVNSSNRKIIEAES